MSAPLSLRNDTALLEAQLALLTRLCESLLSHRDAQLSALLFQLLNSETEAFRTAASKSVTCTSALQACLGSAEAALAISEEAAKSSVETQSRISQKEARLRDLELQARHRHAELKKAIKSKRAAVAAAGDVAASAATPSAAASPLALGIASASVATCVEPQKVQRAPSGMRSAAHKANVHLRRQMQLDALGRRLAVRKQENDWLRRMIEDLEAGGPRADRVYREAVKELENQQRREVK